MPPNTSFAPAKVILLGEHAVTYGQPALAAPINRGVEVSAEVPRDGAATLPERLRRVSGDVFSDALRTLGLRTAFYRSTSTVPPSVGLGSSAAFAVACVKAVAQVAGRTLSRDEVWRLATAAEQHFHGSSSGLDPATVLADGPILFRKGDPPVVEPVRAAARWPLLVAVVGPRAGTGDMVRRLAERYERNPAHHERIFADIGRLVLAARAALEKGDLPGLGGLMNENQALLGELGVSSPELDRFCRRAREVGAWGAKLSGAGAGGAAIAIGPDPAALALALADAATSSFVVEFGRPA